MQGNIQIFKDAECTEYADGTQLPVYARINNPWGFNEGWGIEDGPAGVQITCGGPSSDNPNNTYYISLWIEFSSEEFNEPFTQGQVLEIDGDTSMLPIANAQVIFSKP